MLQNMIIPTGGGGEEKKNIYIRATDRSTSPYQSTGEYEIGTSVVSDSTSYGFVGILLKEPMNLYVEGNSSNTRVIYEDGSTERITNTKTFKENIVGAWAVTNSASLTLSYA